MTRKRVTASAKKQRHEWAIRQIDAGVGLSELTALTAETWGVYRRTARDVTAKAHKDWIEAFNHQDINQRDLLFQCLGRLERTARKAERVALIPEPPSPPAIATSYWEHLDHKLQWVLEGAPAYWSEPSNPQCLQLFCRTLDELRSQVEAEGLEG